MSVTMARRRKVLSQGARLSALSLIGSVMLLPAFNQSVSAACAPPNVDYGSVTNTVMVAANGSYRIWSRLTTSTSMSTAYLLEVDDSDCYAVNDSGLPIASAGDGRYFADNISNWTARTTAGGYIDVNLTAGRHTLKLIGVADDVMLDRLVLTQDKGCIPSGTGENCAAPPDVTSPIVAITAPSSGVVLTRPIMITANATDNDSGVNQVVFYVDDTVIGAVTSSDGNHNYSAALNPAGLTSGNHLIKAVATDQSGNTATSSSVTVTIPAPIPAPTTGAPNTPATPAPTPQKTGDITGDGVVNYLDLSLLASNYNKSGASVTANHSDITGDGKVDYLDLSALASNYNK